MKPLDNPSKKVNRMVSSRALLSVTKVDACAEPEAEHRSSYLGIRSVILICVPEVKHLSEEQKEVIQGLSAPSQLDVKETYIYFFGTQLQVYSYRYWIFLLRSEDACTQPWTGGSTKEAGM